MAKQYYDRYENFKINNQVRVMPFIKIPVNSSDIQVEYKSNLRLDIISQRYYGTPYYGWLIMQANPQFGGLEFDIPEGTIIRVPFPLTTALQQYQQSIDRYKSFYGLD